MLPSFHMSHFLHLLCYIWHACIFPEWQSCQWCSILEYVVSGRLLHSYVECTASNAVLIIHVESCLLYDLCITAVLRIFFAPISYWNIAPEIDPKIVRLWYRHIFLSLNILYLDLRFQHQGAECNLCMWICTHVCVWDGETLLKQCSCAILS